MALPGTLSDLAGLSAGGELAGEVDRWRARVVARARCCWRVPGEDPVGRCGVPCCRQALHRWISRVVVRGTIAAVSPPTSSRKLWPLAPGGPGHDATPMPCDPPPQFVLPSRIRPVHPAAGCQCAPDSDVDRAEERGRSRADLFHLQRGKWMPGRKELGRRGHLQEGNHPIHTLTIMPFPCG
jgi:hypothetical protein